MKAVIQRVSRASVSVDDNIIGQIKAGFLILLGVEKEDTEIEAEVLASKISGLRVFCDENDKMNLSLSDIGGGVLVISNFTLCGNSKKGRRPSFDNAARPDTALPLYKHFCQCMRNAGIEQVEEGEFGADMKVELLNDGPVTLIIDSKELSR
ncbi:MAG: D-tyrosyl-tRNA(Tyr) deacylase [Ruminococcaceae bacterium]|nr:D-tyrosyl-tRNA(Tyr) deacylase [Oscillospiraceae bacterium]